MDAFKTPRPRTTAGCGPSMALASIVRYWCATPGSSGLRRRTSSDCVLPPAAAAPPSMAGPRQPPAPRSSPAIRLRRRASRPAGPMPAGGGRRAGRREGRRKFPPPQRNACANEYAVTRLASAENRSAQKPPHHPWPDSAASMPRPKPAASVIVSSKKKVTPPQL